jgi:hypothetical protein
MSRYTIYKIECNITDNIHIDWTTTTITDRLCKLTKEAKRKGAFSRSPLGNIILEADYVTKSLSVTQSFAKFSAVFKHQLSIFPDATFTEVSELDNKKSRYTECPCGSTIKNKQTETHLSTKKHLSYLANVENIDAAQILMSFDEKK